MEGEGSSAVEEVKRKRKRKRNDEGKFASRFMRMAVEAQKESSSREKALRKELKQVKEENKQFKEEKKQFKQEKKQFKQERRQERKRVREEINHAKRFVSLAHRFIEILGNPPLFLQALHAEVDQQAGGIQLEEREARTFQALLRVANDLAKNMSKLTVDQISLQIWDKLISEFGADEEDVLTLKTYNHDACSSGDEEEIQCAHQSFTEYEFKGEAHKLLYQQLKERREEASLGKHYSPYVALVQSSGVGKTRVLMQTSSLGVYICYCSMAGLLSSASPPRTAKLADQLGSTFHEHDMVLYLKAWLRVLERSICEQNLTADAWKEQQLPNRDGSFKGDIARKVFDEWEGLLREHIEHRNKRSDDLNIKMCSPEITAIKQHFTDPKETCRVLFVFDEARGLQIEDLKTKSMSSSPFYQLRRALRVFFTEKLFFAVFVDTAARLSNLLPSKANEDSERAQRGATSLLPPIYCLPNIALSQPVPGLSAQEYWDPQNWLMYGRPLWAAIYSSRPTIGKFLTFAQQKLVRTLVGDFDGMSVDVLKGIMTESQAIALLSATAGLSICSRSMLAERLAASHMNLILRVTEETRERRIYVGLLAEPILAEAAGHILQHAEVQEAALKHLEKAYLAGYVTPGPRGEFVTKFILVAVVWQLKEEWILRPIPVDQFLAMLLSASTVEDKDRLEKVMEQCPGGGSVFFNSFITIRWPPSTADLGRAFAAGHALMYMAENRLPGADIIIPVWTSKGMTAIVVSAKNIQNAGWLKQESMSKVKSEFTHIEVAKGVPSITILMSVREPQMKGNVNWGHWKSTDPHYIHLACYGIDCNYSFLTDTVKELLKKLLVTVPDELSDATDKEKALIRIMVPEQFEPADSTFKNIPKKRRKLQCSRN